MNLEDDRAATAVDARLLKAVAQGDETAIETLYRSNVDGVFRFVYRRVNESYEDAEEITQDTFLSALKLAHGFRGEASLLGWLCALARVRLIDFYRRNRRDKRIPREMIDSIEGLDPMQSMSTEGNPFDLLDEAQLVDRLMAAISEQEAEALMLRYVEGFSLKEVAAQLGRSEKGVDGLLDRAKRKQRKQVELWRRSHG